MRSAQPSSIHVIEGAPPARGRIAAGVFQGLPDPSIDQPGQRLLVHARGGVDVDAALDSDVYVATTPGGLERRAVVDRHVGHGGQAGGADGQAGAGKSHAAGDLADAPGGLVALGVEPGI